MTDLMTAWTAVHDAAKPLGAVHLGDLFARDPKRFDVFSAEADGIFIDYSKEKIDAAAMTALLGLAEAAGVSARRAAMLAGEPINTTEGRAVLHTALRASAGDSVLVDGHDVMPDVITERDRMLAFAEDVRSGRYATAGGGRFTDIINIGIGGSDLGPAMAVPALAPYCDGPAVHFVSNIDGAHLTDTLRGLDPATTMIVVASKTFTTMETMTNARSARGWLEAALGDQAGRHVAAVSTNLVATKAFGIDDDRVFGFWDWVGGRYSMWSVIGLPLAIAVGAEGFRGFLDGGAAMDRHFAAAPADSNLPILLALVGIWRRNAMGWPTVAVLPYDQRLARFPAYLQQLDMESNGKRIGLDGQPVTMATGPAIFGEPGTNSQHSFFQLLHQGTDVIPADFLIAESNPHSQPGHHALLTASVLAQSAALAFGKTEDTVRAELTASGMDSAEIDRLAPHKTFPGDRPSTMILYPELTPFALGQLIALWEHKIFVQGVIWGINSFDQWGVELGKVLTQTISPLLEGGDLSALDGSTRGLIERLR